MALPDKHGIGIAVTKRLNLHQDYFHRMRLNNPNKLAYIKSLHPDMARAYDMYIEENRAVTQVASDIYIEVEENKERPAFGRFLKEKGIYKHPFSYHSTESILFTSEGMIKTFRSFIKIKRSNELYKEFREKQDA